LGEDVTSLLAPTSIYNHGCRSEHHAGCGCDSNATGPNAKNGACKNSARQILRSKWARLLLGVLDRLPQPLGTPAAKPAKAPFFQSAVPLKDSSPASQAAYVHATPPKRSIVTPIVVADLLSAPSDVSFLTILNCSVDHVGKTCARLSSQYRSFLASHMHDLSLLKGAHPSCLGLLPQSLRSPAQTSLHFQFYPTLVHFLSAHIYFFVGAFMPQALLPKPKTKVLGCAK
jgi:hypothetical protein